VVLTAATQRLSSWHFKLFHEEDARSNIPQKHDTCLTTYLISINRIIATHGVVEVILHAFLISALAFFTFLPLQSKKEG